MYRNQTSRCSWRKWRRSSSDSGSEPFDHSRPVDTPSYRRTRSNRRTPRRILSYHSVLFERSLGYCLLTKTNNIENLFEQSNQEMMIALYYTVQLGRAFDEHV